MILTQAMFIEYCENPLHTSQISYDGSSRVWRQKLLVTEVEMEDKKQGMKLSNIFKIFIRMILL